MKKARKKLLDNVTIASATHSAKAIIGRTIEYARMFTDDPDKVERRKSGECPVCYYYKGRCGGSMCTEVECSKCGKVLRSENTCVDTLCLRCAAELSLCKHCGGDIDARQRRKQRFSIDTERE